MKICCPKCNAAGNIPEHEIPEAGRFANCPRCQQGFTVMKPRASRDAYLVDTCPACNFSTFGDETFGIYPNCQLCLLDAGTNPSYDRRLSDRDFQHRFYELTGRNSLIHTGALSA